MRNWKAILWIIALLCGSVWTGHAQRTICLLYTSRLSELFTYFPSHDSLVIQVKQATRLSASVKDWKQALTTAGNKTIIANNKTAKNYVTIQDLVKADEIRIVTIADVKETDITLGFTGCVQAGTDKVSLEDGLYVIQNAETNKYLASPILSLIHI